MAMLRARRIYADERRSVIVVESFESHHEIVDGMLGLFAWSEPVAVVTSGADGTRAVDTNGKPSDLDRLLLDAAGLDALLDWFRHGTGEFEVVMTYADKNDFESNVLRFERAGYRVEP